VIEHKCVYTAVVPTPSGCLQRVRGDKDMAAMTEIAHGLRFPEGPVAMPDGSVILVEIERQTLSRVHANGEVSVIATPGGGPNGAAMGPDGRCYVCNNGGFESSTPPEPLRTPG